MYYCQTASQIHMSQYRKHPATPLEMLTSIWRNRRLITRMVGTEVVGRYKGSVLGLAWSFLIPLFMLAVYTVVFSGIFKSKWGINTGQSHTQYAVMLFVGLIVHSVFAEVINRAPYLITRNANYVKKVVFPLEILPVVTLGASLFHAMVSLVALLAAFVLFNGYLNWTAFFVPLVFFPLVAFTLGIAWAIASLGAYLRDVGQTVGIITTALLFLSGVFYPISALPEKYQRLMLMNPLAYFIDQAREVLIWGHVPNWMGLAIYTAIALAIASLGFAWFQKTRKGFADVL